MRLAEQSFFVGGRRDAFGRAEFLSGRAARAFRQAERVFGARRGAFGRRRRVFGRERFPPSGRTARARAAGETPAAKICGPEGLRVPAPRESPSRFFDRVFRSECRPSFD